MPAFVDIPGKMIADRQHRFSGGTLDRYIVEHIEVFYGHGDPPKFMSSRFDGRTTSTVNAGALVPPSNRGFPAPTIVAPLSSISAKAPSCLVVKGAVSDDLHSMPRIAPVAGALI